MPPEKKLGIWFSREEWLAITMALNPQNCLHPKEWNPLRTKILKALAETAPRPTKETTP